MIDMVYIVDSLLLLFLLVSALAIVCSTDLLVVTVLLSIFSLLMAATYLVMDAPDVAITEAAVGTGISTVVLLAAISLAGRYESRRKKRTVNALSFLIVALVGIGLFYAVQDMPAFGWSGAPVHNQIAAYYIEGTRKFMGFTNVVTAILASFRGYDTLGETAVVLVAAVSVMLMLWDRDEKDT